MTFPQIFFSTSPEETAIVSQSLAKEKIPARVINLVGDLGAGKTFFVKKFCEVFGILNVASPTFALVNEYKNSRSIYHFDFYRINSVNEIIEFGFSDYLNDENSLCFIEWGNRFPEILPKKRMEINFSVNENFSRQIKIDLLDD